MRLRSIEITGFQSIAHAVLELGDWTSLVGTSDVGKSACLRALYALLTNQRGEHFIRQGEPSCTVLVTREDGLEVEWRKGREKSGAYRIGELVYDRTAGDVPPEVRAALPMMVEIDGAPFMPGFQRQHDRPFMFGDTARWRAQALGEFDGTNILLLAETRLRSQQRTAQGQVKAQEQRAEQLRHELEDLAFLPELERALEAAQAAYEARQHAEGRLAGVGATLMLSERMLRMEERLRVPYEEVSAHLAEAEELMSELVRGRAEQRYWTMVIERLSAPEVELPGLPDLEPVRLLAHRVSDGRRLATRLEELVDDIATLEEELSYVAADLATFNVCPTCGRVLE